jgi:hypothetical protein
MINAKLQSIIDTKSAIGNAIVNKGGTVTSATPFFNYASEINNISTGTPQTVFQDSTGAKWARTNAVNLTNVSNNVTSDFNWWQPANNTTSDSIMTVGTVNSNISGNIRIVQVNQVNIAQYVNLVATDTSGGKYVGFNGYDQLTNPTPTGNTTFNRWLLNNSATGTVVFANATFTTGTYNGPNTTTSTNIFNVAFINNSWNNTTTTSKFLSSFATNGLVYVGGLSQPVIVAFLESNIRQQPTVVSPAVNYGGGLREISFADNFVFSVGGFPNLVQKFHLSNLVRVSNSTGYGLPLGAITTNNGFVFIGEDGGTIRKLHQSNLVLNGSTVNYGGRIEALVTSNGFLFAGGLTTRTIRKYHESNLTFVAESANTGEVFNLAVNNGFIYWAGRNNTGSDHRVRKYHQSNLALSASAAIMDVSYIQAVAINNGFVYAGGSGSDQGGRFFKYYESTLGNVAGSTLLTGGDEIHTITINNGAVYWAGLLANQGNQIFKFQEEQQITIPETLTFYTATKIKE